MRQTTAKHTHTQTMANEKFQFKSSKLRDCYQTKNKQNKKLNKMKKKKTLANGYFKFENSSIWHACNRMVRKKSKRNGLSIGYQQAPKLLRRCRTYRFQRWFASSSTRQIVCGWFTFLDWFLVFNFEALRLQLQSEHTHTHAHAKKK